VTKDALKDFSIVELKLAIKRIIRCYVSDLGRKPTVKEIDAHYRRAIMEFLEERTSWFQTETWQAPYETGLEAPALKKSSMKPGLSSLPYDTQRRNIWTRSRSLK
jgi:hypothetical protein